MLLQLETPHANILNGYSRIIKNVYLRFLEQKDHNQQKDKNMKIWKQSRKRITDIENGRKTPVEEISQSLKDIEPIVTSNYKLPIQE